DRPERAPAPLRVQSLRHRARWAERAQRVERAAPELGRVPVLVETAARVVQRARPEWPLRVWLVAALLAGRARELLEGPRPGRVAAEVQPAQALARPVDLPRQGSTWPRGRAAPREPLTFSCQWQWSWPDVPRPGSAR